MNPDTIKIYNEKEIQKIKVACKLARDVLDMIEPYVVEGVSTEELDEICHNYITKAQKAIPAPLNYCGFPKSTCISVNDVICHGIPSKDKILKNGDILNIDITVIKDGYYGDNSKMYIVGTPSILAKRLCEKTQESLYKSIKDLRPGNRLNTIGESIEKFIKPFGYSIVKEYCGHGVGSEFHQDPQILHYKASDGGVTLEPGMIFTIEPMINVGKAAIKTLNDGWTVKTKDRSLSAQYEHQILITKTGCEVLTIRDEEIESGKLQAVYSYE